MPSSTYALQCAVREVHYGAVNGRAGSIENRRGYYGHCMALRKVGRVWVSALSDPFERRYPWWMKKHGADGIYNG